MCVSVFLKSYFRGSVFSLVDLSIFGMSRYHSYYFGGGSSIVDASSLLYIAGSTIFISVHTFLLSFLGRDNNHL